MADQADNLRVLMDRKAKNLKSPNNTQIIAISSGKGGVGKTSLVVNMAIALSKKGKKVMIMDADLGMANVDVMLGLVPRFTLYDVLDGKKNLEEVIVEGAEGVNIIPGCSGIFEMDNISILQKQNLSEALEACTQEKDYVLIDTAAGISPLVLGFITAADDVMIVITPEPTSITDGYAMIKILSEFKLHEKVYLVVNIAGIKEARDTAQKIEIVANRYLDIEIVRLGFINYDSTAKRAIQEMVPFISQYPRSQVSRDVIQIANNLCQNKNGFNKSTGAFAQKLICLQKSIRLNRG